MTFDEPILYYRIDYSRPYWDEETQRAGLVSADEENATRCVIYVERYGGEMTFLRESPEADWPYDKQNLERMLVAAFQQGRDKQRALTSQVLKRVIG